MFLSKNFKKFLVIFTIILILLSFSYFNVFYSLNSKIYDILQVLKYIISPIRVERIVIVSIGDKTLDRLGEWPLDRGYYSKIINHLERAEVKGIGIDLILTEIFSESGDRQLAETLQKYDNIVLPVVADLKLVRGLHKQKSTILNIKKPLPRFAQRSKLGHINFIPDRDGIIRHFPGGLSGPKKYLAFSQRMASFINDKSIKNQSYLSFDQISFNQKKLGFNDKIKGLKFLLEPSRLINYIGPAGTIPHISFVDLLRGRVNTDFFQNKLVLIGVDAPGLGDRYMTSFSRYGYLTGVELHGQVLYNILEGKFLTTLSFDYHLLLLFIILFILSILFIKVNPKWSFFILVIIIIFYIFSLFYFFYYFNVYFRIGNILISTVILYGVSLIQWYLGSEKEKKQLINTFSRYVSTGVIQELRANPELLKPGGRSTEVSILFLDIRGFTAYAEDKNPAEVIKLLNYFFSDLDKIIFNYDGTIDKYLGDGLMAFFGAPVFTERHQEQAVLSALKMQEIVNSSELPFEIGIGINSGRVIVGNVGSEKRMDYTVIGDVVNKAAHFVNIAGEREIIIGESTFGDLSVRDQNLNWQREKNDTFNIYIYRLPFK